MGEQTELLKKITEVAQTAPAMGFGMAGAAVINLMSGNLTEDVISPVICQVSGAKDEISKSSISESSGLVVSENDLKSIFLYVDMALNLPKDITEAETYLGYKSDDEFFKDEAHKFLLPQNQVTFDTPIIEHAKQWAGIEQAIKDIGVTLEIYSSEFVDEAEGVLEVLDAIKKARLCMPVHEFYDGEGKELVEGVHDMFENWKKNTKEKQESTTRLKERLLAFDDALENTIKGSVEKRKKQISDMKLSEEIKVLNDKVNALSDEIKKLQKEYDEDVGLAFTGAAGMVFPPIGIISWSVTGGIYGAKAEKIRKKKNEKEIERAPFQKKLDTDNRVLGGIQVLESLLGDFHSAIISAIQGVQHVDTVWNGMVSDIDNAQKHLAHISDPDYVKRIGSLCKELRAAKDAWGTCGNITKELVDTFDRARSSYKKA